MEYILATALLGSLTIIFWSKNRQSPQDYSQNNAQLARIEQKIDRILQEFDIKGSRDRANYEIQLQTEFDLILEQFPREQKIAVLKAVRIITGLGLREAKDLIESPLPVVVKQRLSEIEAEKAQQMLQEAGARISLR